MVQGWPVRLAALSTIAAAATAVSAAGSQTHFRSSADPTDCIQAATAHALNDILRLGGEGTSIVLCPYAHVSVSAIDAEPITFTAANQAIYTQGWPEDHTRATITIENDKGHTSGDLTTAIKADCKACRAVKIGNLHIDGGRDVLGAVEMGDALIVVGGAQGETEVRHVDAWAARGYAVIHADEGPQGSCTGVVISDNTIHSAGNAPLDLQLSSELVRLRDGPPPYRGNERPGTWTDGISVACAQSTVSDNTIRDVSGVGIALRGAPATQVVQNTIIARDRDMLVGISVVAHPVFTRRAGNIGGVVIRENRIHAASAMIRVGISTGAGAWSTDELIGDHEIAFGSEIVKNRVSSYTGYLGYAVAISDARGATVQGNAVSASIWGFETSACYERPTFALPTPLIRDPRSVIGSLQTEFTSQHYGFLLCVGPGTPSSSGLISRHQINDAFMAQHGGHHRDASGLGMGSGLGRKKGSSTAGGTKGKAAVIPVVESHPHRGGVVQNGGVGGGRVVPAAVVRRGGGGGRVARQEGLPPSFAEAHSGEDDDDDGDELYRVVAGGARESEKAAMGGKKHVGMKRRKMKAPRKVSGSGGSRGRYAAEVKRAAGSR